MSSNPFLVSKVDTLKEAFPTLDHTVLENTLFLENGDMAKTFERLLAMTDPSATSITPTPTPASPPCRAASTAATTTPTNQPRIRPPNISSQQRPLPTTPAKPTFQSVREELAQWRQELSNDQNLRRTSRRSHRKSQPHSGLRSSASSNYELQSAYRYTYSLGDAVNEGKAAALNAATSFYDRIIAAHSVYGNASLSSSVAAPSSSSSSSSAASYAYHQSNNTTPNLYSRSSTSSATISSSSRPYNNNNNNNNTSSLAPSSSTSRNRPLPHPPQPTQQNHVARNPFDSSDHADALPPPTYEAREHDTLIDPLEADRLLLHTSSHTS